MKEKDMLNANQLNYFLKTSAIAHAAAIFNAEQSTDDTELDQLASFAAGIQCAIEDLDEALAFGSGEDTKEVARRRFLAYSEFLLVRLRELNERKPGLFADHKTANIASVLAEKALGWERCGSPFHLEGGAA